MKGYSLNFFVVFYISSPLPYASFRAWEWKREAEQLIKQLKLISFFHITFRLSKKHVIFGVFFQFGSDFSEFQAG